MTQPSYLNPETPKRKSINQEKKLAKKGFCMPASGALWPFKGDVSFPDHLVEAKRTDGKSMAVSAEWLEKIYKEATAESKTPGVELEIGNYYIQGIVFKK